MEKHCDHCVIDFKNKIIKTYDDGVNFTYDKFDCIYLIDVTINHLSEGVWISGSEIHMRYTDKPIEITDIDGVVSKKYIKKCGTTKLEKWFGEKECEYVQGEYYVKYNNQVTQLLIPKDTFIFKHTTTIKKSQE